jgi:hypothetical protein
MDPAAPAPAPGDADAEAMGESFVYVDDSEFADAEAGSEPGMTAGGDGPLELPEELARGVVCLECVTSPEAMEAGEDSTCRVYVVGTAHVSQVSSISSVNCSSYIYLCTTLSPARFLLLYFSNCAFPIGSRNHCVRTFVSVL